ncbi:MAG: hypothetical protein HYS57_03325 [Parcubacteria group bacterium]|nr:hypothetical protein [Parcubacteria group bacterium]
MALEELERELYKRDHKEEASRKPPEPSTRREVVGEVWGSKTPALTPSPVLPQKGRDFFRKVKPVLIGVVVVATAGVVGWIVYILFFSGNNIEIAIRGPVEVRSGEPLQYEVVVENRTRDVLANPLLMMRGGDGIEFIEAPDRTVLQRALTGSMAPQSVRKEVATVAMWGKIEEERTLEATVRYNVGAGTVQFERVKTLKIKIVNPAFTIEDSFPTRVIAAEPFSFTVGWKNELARDITRTRAELSTPDGFTVASTIPKALATATPATWDFGVLTPGATQGFSVSGVASGEEGEVLKYHLRTGVMLRGVFTPLVEADFEVGISTNPLALAVLVNDQKEYHATLGEILRYSINFKNNFDTPLKDVIVTASLEGDMYDLPSVDTDGAFSSRERKITWHGGNTPQLLALDAEESGNVTVSVKVRDVFPTGVRNATLKFAAEISTATKPKLVGTERGLRQSAELSTKVNGTMDIMSRVYRRDPEGRLTNAGPWPLKANETSQFAVYWIVKATANDFRGVEMKTVLPNNVTFVGNTKGDLSGTDVVANPRTNEVFWRIAKLAAGETKRLIFQTAATPSVSDVGSYVLLLNKVVLAGIDDWTGNTYAKETIERTSKLSDDATVNQNEGKVLAR